RVGTGQWGDVARQPGPGAAQALGHRPESTSIRLAGEPPIELAREIGQLFRVAGKSALESVGQPVIGDTRRDGLHEPLAYVLVAAQHVVGLDSDRLSGDLGGDRRIAVTVATDPAP